MIKNNLESNRVKLLSNLPFKNSSYFPNTIEYKDIDTSFLDFVNNDLKMISENNIIPSFFITQQRFSEFTKTWEYLDENSNLMMNFKLVARDNNPQVGTGYNRNYNISGDYMFEYLRVKTFDGSSNGVDIYKMKQPFNVDLMYEVRFVTNKYEILNNFNLLILDTFKARQHYLNVNGYHIPIVLESISDESSKNINERKFYSQVFKIKALAYIITKNDFKVEKAYKSILISNQCDTSKSSIYLEKHKKNKYNLFFNFPPNNKNITSFYSNANYIVSDVKPDDTIEKYEIYINDRLINTTKFRLNIGDKLIIKIIKVRQSLNSNIIFTLK